MTQVPTRLLILQRLTDHLKGITPAEGYDFDLSGENSVFRGRVLLGQEIKPLPVISILEASRPDASADFFGENNEMLRDQWTLLVQGLCEDDLKHPTDIAYHLEAAVRLHLSRITAVDNATGDPLYPDAHYLGGLITSLEIAPPVVRPPEDKVSSTAFFFLPVRVGVALRSDRPYTTV